MKFSIREILIQEKITALAHEAQEACEVIKEAFANAFSIGQKEIQCFGMDWNFDTNFTSVTISIDGFFTFQDIHVPISENGFFTCFVAELELQMNNEIGARNSQLSLDHDVQEEEKLVDFGLTNEEKYFADAAHVLRDFVLCCKRKLDANCEKTRCIS